MRWFRRVSWRAFAVALAMVAVAACGGGSATDSTSADTTGTTIAVPTESTAPPTTSGEEFDAESYFGGRAIRMVVIGSVGGPQDVSGRVIAARLGEFIPGNPTVNVTNLEGVGGMNRVYETDATDELVIGASSNLAELAQDAQLEEAEYDPLALRMLGALGPAARTIMIRSDTGYADLGDAVDATDGNDLIYPGAVNEPEAVTGSEMLFPWMCDRLAMPCTAVQVADDDSGVTGLMMERNEINVSIGLLSSRLRRAETQLADGTYRLGIIFGVPAEADLVLPDGVDRAPNMSEILPDDLQEEWLALQPLVSHGGFTDAFWVSPTIPDKALAVIRDGLDAMMADEAVVTELETAYGSEIPPWISGGDAEEMLHEVTNAYNANLSNFADLQEQYWQEYWNTSG